MKQENILKLDKSLCAHVFWFARTKPGLLDGANKATLVHELPRHSLSPQSAAAGPSSLHGIYHEPAPLGREQFSPRLFALLLRNGKSRKVEEGPRSPGKILS